MILVCPINCVGVVDWSEGSRCLCFTWRPVLLCAHVHKDMWQFQLNRTSFSAPIVARPSAMAERCVPEPDGYIPLWSIRPNPNHAPASPETIQENLRAMKNHALWCRTHFEKWMAAQQSPVAPGPEDREDVADLVARVMSAGLKGKSGEAFREMARAFRSLKGLGRVTAEMTWIIVTCDPDDEQFLFCLVANLAREKMAISMNEPAFEKASEQILIEAGEKIRMHQGEQLSQRLGGHDSAGPSRSMAG